MKVYYIFICSSLFAISFLGAQDIELPVHYYFSTGDYMEDKLSPDQVLLIVRKQGDDYIYVREINDPLTGKKSDEGAKAWAIHYKGKTYLNLKYSQNGYAKNLFVQVDIKGRFCLAVMDPEFAPVLEKADSDGNMVIGGMSHPYDGSVGGNFLDQEGIEKLIFFIDTKDLSIVLPYKANNAPVNLLTASTLKWLVGKENFKGSKKAYTVEEIVEIVEDVNRRQ